MDLAQQKLTNPAATMQLMMTSPQLVTALVGMLRLGRKEQRELQSVANFSTGSRAQQDADQWTEAILYAEIAIKEAYKLSPESIPEGVIERHEAPAFRPRLSIISRRTQ